MEWKVEEGKFLNFFLKKQTEKKKMVIMFNNRG